eukprot:2519844-Pyramimonas_sp.AAC.1
MNTRTHVNTPQQSYSIVLVMVTSGVQLPVLSVRSTGDGDERGAAPRAADGGVHGDPPAHAGGELPDCEAASLRHRLLPHPGAGAGGAQHLHRPYPRPAGAPQKHLHRPYPRPA